MAAAFLYDACKSLSGRNRTSDPVIADIYSHMLYQLSYAESPHRCSEKRVDTEGFEPSTSRMRNGRSSTELSAPDFSYAIVPKWSRGWT